ncbi:site-2 protease family protein [Halorientalis marina]|uniref:site-2 protease family protein n=1 Tax=Halorientalis marina TaxID=2931976 RepID=UPI001FF17B67|nr:site-2 protease family protein [Halorientalis marina]
MDAREAPAGAPPVERIESAFRVREVRRDGDAVLYVGQPTADSDALERDLWPVFREHGYEVSLRRRYEPETGPRVLPGNYVLVAEPQSVGLDGVPWLNVALFVLTAVSTLFAGHWWYGIDVSADPAAIVQAWPFTVAVLGVLGVHELGHYVMSRYHRVSASLPYFIPFPTIFGTMGAVIKMRGRIPDRRALFDIGVAGPLAGLVATGVVTVVGLYMDPVSIPIPESGEAVFVDFNYPLLLHALADLTGQPLRYADPSLSVNPVVMGGWIGMFITFLNLLPVGQLDGGHIVRAILGERTETFSAFVPAGLFGLSGYLFFAQGGRAVFIWFVWGLFALGLAYAGPTTPVRDEPLDRTRVAVGVLTFALGLACFTPIPLEIVRV